MNNKWKFAGVAALLLVGLPVGCSMISTVNTVATTPGRVVSKTMQTDNVIMNYERFHDLKANYDARLAQVTETADAMATEQDADERRRLRTELSAQRASCRALATGYNADSVKINRNLFKGASLPETLSKEACDA